MVSNNRITIQANELRKLIYDTVEYFYKDQATIRMQILRKKDELGTKGATIPKDTASRSSKTSKGALRKKAKDQKAAEEERIREQLDQI